MSQAGLTNEKLYQARLVLALVDPASSRSLNNALLDATVFLLHTGLLSFLREIAATHRLPSVHIPSLDALERELSQHGISNSSVQQLRYLIDERQWPAQLMSWYRAASEAEIAPAARHQGQAISVVDADALLARNHLVPDVHAASDVLQRLCQFIETQRANLVEW